MVPLTASRCSHVPLVLEKLSCVMPAPLTRPSPLNTSDAPPVVLTTAFLDPSRLDFFCTIRGASVSEGCASQAPEGSERLTTQLSAAALTLQPLLRFETNCKRTAAFRRIASARARLMPARVVSAAFRICVFCRNCANAGTPSVTNKATMTSASIISMSEKPRVAQCLSTIRFS